MSEEETMSPENAASASATAELPRHLQAADLIKQYIFQNKLEPGRALPHEGELAKNFAMSRTSIREALKYLSAQGFVQVHHGSGVYVATPSAFPTVDQIHFQVQADDSYYDDLLEMRFLIEMGIAPLVVKRIEQKHLDAMSLAIRQAQREFAKGVADLRQYDLEFHLAYLNGSGNQVVADYGEVLRRFFALGAYGQPNRTPEIVARTLDEHVTIYTCIMREDVPGLTATLAQHLNRRKRILGQP